MIKLFIKRFLFKIKIIWVTLKAKPFIDRDDDFLYIKKIIENKPMYEKEIIKYLKSMHSLGNEYKNIGNVNFKIPEYIKYKEIFEHDILNKNIQKNDNTSDEYLKFVSGELFIDEDSEKDFILKDENGSKI